MLCCGQTVLFHQLFQARECAISLARLKPDAMQLAPMPRDRSAGAAASGVAADFAPMPGGQVDTYRVLQTVADASLVSDGPPLGAWEPLVGATRHCGEQLAQAICTLHQQISNAQPELQLAMSKAFPLVGRVVDSKRTSIGIVSGLLRVQVNSIRSIVQRSNARRRGRVRKGGSNYTAAQRSSAMDVDHVTGEDSELAVAADATQVGEQRLANIEAHAPCDWVGGGGCDPGVAAHIGASLARRIRGFALRVLEVEGTS